MSKKYNQYTVTISDEVIDDLKQEAKELERSINNLVSHIVTKYYREKRAISELTKVLDESQNSS